MKVIRADRGIYVPHDPEKPDNNQMRLLQKGLVALVPESYVLPEGSYKDLGKLDLNKLKKEKQG